MSTVNRVNRKATDADIVTLNSVGFSLGTIARMLGVHPTTVTIRLRSLKVPPADTRRTFMEDILNTLSDPEKDWLVTQLSPTLSIKDFVTNLLRDKYQAANQGQQP